MKSKHAPLADLRDECNTLLLRPTQNLQSTIDSCGPCSPFTIAFVKQTVVDKKLVKLQGDCTYLEEI